MPSDTITGISSLGIFLIAALGVFVCLPAWLEKWKFEKIVRFFKEHYFIATMKVEEEVENSDECWLISFKMQDPAFARELLTTVSYQYQSTTIGEEPTDDWTNAEPVIIGRQHYKADLFEMWKSAEQGRFNPLVRVHDDHYEIYTVKKYTTPESVKTTHYRIIDVSISPASFESIYKYN